MLHLSLLEIFFIFFSFPFCICHNFPTQLDYHLSFIIFLKVFVIQMETEVGENGMGGRGSEVGQDSQYILFTKFYERAPNKKAT